MSQDSSRKPRAFQRVGASRSPGRAGQVIIPAHRASRHPDPTETQHDPQTRPRPRPCRPRRGARSRPGEARLGHPRPHPRGRLPPLAGHGDGGAADRRPRPAPHRLAAVQEGRRLGAAAARDLGPRERPPGELAVRPGLELRAVLGARRVPDVLPARRAADGLDRRHERPGARQGPPRQGRVGGRRGGAEGEDRRDGPVGGPAARAQGARGRRRLQALHREAARRPGAVPDPRRARRARPDGPGGPRGLHAAAPRPAGPREALRGGEAAGRGRALGARRQRPAAGRRSLLQEGRPAAGDAARGVRHPVEPRGAPPRPQDRGRGGDRREGRVPRGRHERLQRRGRAPGHGQEGRGRDPGRPPRLLAPGDGSHRQRRRLRGHDGGPAHPESRSMRSRGAPSGSASGAGRSRVSSARAPTSTSTSPRARRRGRRARTSCRPSCGTSRRRPSP